MTDDVLVRTRSEARLGHLIKRCEQTLIHAKSQALRSEGLTVPQYVAMLVLSETPGISGAALARQCGVTAQAMASLLASLEQKELITRTHSAAHPKVLLTKLTRSGQAKLRRADQAALAIERRLSDAFSDEEMAAFRTYLTTALTVLTEPTA